MCEAKDPKQKLRNYNLRDCSKLLLKILLVAMLKKMGTYAGNDAIVAFAKLYGLNVVIHQLNSPIWTVS